VLLNGFPKYLSGLEMLKSCSGARLCLALVLRAPVDVLRPRAAARHASGERPEDDAANFSFRFEKYQECTVPIFKHLLEICRVQALDATAPEETVEAEAINAWNFAMQAAGGSSEAEEGAQGSARQRADPEEADIEVSVCLMSGREVMRPLLPARSKVTVLRQMLFENGEAEFNLRFYHEGQELQDSDLICAFNGFANGAVIQMMREEKPPPPPPPVTRRSYSYVCFTADSIVSVLGTDGASEVQLRFDQVAVGHFVRTGLGTGMDSYRRVQRVWAHHWQNYIPTFELALGCRVTPGHPILQSGKWVKPESIQPGKATFEEAVYQLEVEGHVDTVLVGGIVCALLGRYCGPDFGWNVFTRKTVKCDRQPCKQCEKAFMPGLSFHPATLLKHMLPPATFEPY